MDVKLGRLIEEDEIVYPDAVHVAVAPVTAARDINVGSKVKLLFGSKDKAVSADYDDLNAIGIADPMLCLNDDLWTIEAGQRFWLYLFPGTVDGMRHQWSHPSFNNSSTQHMQECEVWLRQFADLWCFDLQILCHMELNL